MSLEYSDTPADPRKYLPEPPPSKGAVWRELREAVEAWREAAEGDSNDAEHDAAAEIVALVESLDALEHER